MKLARQFEIYILIYGYYGFLINTTQKKLRVKQYISHTKKIKTERRTLKKITKESQGTLCKNGAYKKFGNTLNNNKNKKKQFLGKKH